MITPRITNKTVICEQAPNHGSYFAYARLIARVNFQFSTKDTKDQIGVEEATEWELQVIFRQIFIFINCAQKKSAFRNRIRR